ncbi:hypothetical protein, partial [Hymenobacter terricola]|uniref:hypothetical protein n=1 Tax=Hymenobacter terricola TaxID=2819236 RepID=UPI001CF5481B
MSTLLHSRRRPLGWAFLLLAALLLNSRPGQAQVDTYTLAPSTGTFAPLVGGTPVPTVQADDALSAALPVGFTFVFDGTPYTSCKVSSNGWLTFNAAASANSLTNDLATGAATERPRVAPFWDDLNGSTGTASYLTSGTAPNRTFTFEWLNWFRYGNTTGPSFSMQVQLVEGTNLVRFVYRQETGAISNALASIGLSGAGTGSGSFLSLSDATPAPTTSSTTETTSIATLPATGQIYTFTPAAPALCPTPRNLTTTALTNTTATVSYTVTNTTPGPFTILYGLPGFNPALANSATNPYFTAPATGTTATLTGLAVQTTYQFYVRQNCGGTNGNSVVSVMGTFTTNPNPAVNDDCAQAIVLPVGTACTTPTAGTVFGATQSTAPTTACSGTTAQDVWYSFVATSNSHTITFAPQFAGVYDVRTGTCAASTSIFCASAAAAATNINTIGGLTAGQPYFLRVYASGATPPAATASTFTLCIVPGPPTPANDDCAGAINAPVQFGTCVGQTSADNTAATASTGVPAPGCASYVSKDVWFKVTVPASGTFTVETVPPTAGSPIIDTGVAVYSGACATLALVGCDDDSSPNGNFSLLTVTGRTPGEILYVRVWSYGSNTVGLLAVCVTSPSNCSVPTGPTSSNLTNTTATLSWTAPTGGLPAGNTYELEYGLSGFAQGTGTNVTALT